ncbi:MAG TPA: hypothetical protein VFT50_18205 [Baekduia sp.]|nr:hypothetical protein [Baekduia sp.]
MTDFIDGLERDLVAAARRLAAAETAGEGQRRPRRRSPLRSLPIAATLLVLSAGSAAAGTLLALRGAVIPAPVAVPPEQTPAPGTARISELRAADPDPGAPPWTLRVARSRTGLLCSTVGQVRDGRFGLVGLDGRFRVLADGVSDSCGIERRDAASLIGARVFDARRRATVRTVVSGVAGPGLRSVTVTAGGRRRRPPVGKGGTFVLPLRGYPEDLAIRVILRFGDGRREVHALGRSPSVVPDPAGGGAWRTQSFRVSGDRRTCVSFLPARPGPSPPVSPAACGDLGDGLRRHGVFFAVRRIAPGTGGTPVQPQGDGHWGGHPARTAVWGAAGDDVAAVSVQRRGRPAQRLRLVPGAQSFLAVYPPSVDPRSLTVRVRRRDGRPLIVHGSHGLVRHPLPPTHAPPMPTTP